MLGSSGLFPPHPQIPRMRETLEHIEMHLPFEVLPSWAAQAHDRRSAARSAMLLQGAERLDRLGSNLANAYHTLRMEYGEEHWRTTMEYIRLGLGEEIESIDTRVDPGGGAIALWLKLRNRDRRLPASVLADGVLAYLAFVALFRLRAARTLLAFDEPELHLNPSLLIRVVDLFESMAVDYPVILATHSDRLLDTLRDPASSVRVCETDGLAGSMQVRGLDPDALGQWLDGYRGLGDLRGAGQLSMVLKPESSA
jgi:predicted ATPase